MKQVISRLFVVMTIALAFAFNAFAQTKAFDLSRMDTTADACTDFFQFANGSWVKNTPMPPAFPRWGSFNILAESNNAILKSVLEEAEKNSAGAGSDSQLIGDFYSSCMDEPAIEKLGASPLKPLFKRISKISSVKSLQREIAWLHSRGFPALFAFGASPDAKNSTMYIANAFQGGLSLPNRDYYTKGDAKSQETREKFREYMQNMFKLAGYDEKNARWNAFVVMKIQMRLANASRTPTELRDPVKRYNKKTLAELATMTPAIAWNDYIAARGIAPIADMNVGQPDFFVEVNKMLTEVPLDEWKIYLRWMVLNASAPRLSKAFVDENFNFFGKYLSGTKELLPRWRRCVQGTDNLVGEALGQEFVKKTFTPEAKRRMNQMIDNLFAAYRERIGKLDWMTDETKQKALAKLSTFNRKIGYPDKLRGYEGLRIDRRSYFDNIARAAQFEIARNLKDINQPVDRTRWGMTPPTVNAYYTPLLNEIVFPAGILQPPFFNFNADDAINYGGIGAVIGHEITHGFDDSGSQYDAEGNLKSWWTADDRKEFEARASCVANQFSAYEVQPGVFMNGRLTLGENIADLGGLTMAYEAFKIAQASNPQTENIDGFTAEQRFFLGWAQVWAAKATAEAERQQVLTDPHALARWRVNGPMSNLPQFAQAFGCRAPAKMIRENACKIW